jgi:hypothetical protein
MNRSSFRCSSKPGRPQHRATRRDTCGRDGTATIIARRLFISYFEVPKKDPGLYRAIANCKAMNALFHSVISFGLATIIEVFRVIAFAGFGFFAVMDLRHWFHQLTLPSDYTRLFSFRFGREIWGWRTWPMGFAAAQLDALVRD